MLRLLMQTEHVIVILAVFDEVLQFDLIETESWQSTQWCIGLHELAGEEALL